MDVLKFSEWNNLSFTEEFLKILGNSVILESDNIEVDKLKTINDIITRLKLKSEIYKELVPLFNKVYSLIEAIINNSDLNIETNTNTLSLMTLATINIAYIEVNAKIANANILEILKIDSKSLLEENKLVGVGNGIIKKLVKCITSIGKLSSIMLNKMGYNVSNFFNLLLYKKLINPILNSIINIITKYKINLDNFNNKISSIVDNLNSAANKNNFKYYLDKIKSSFKAVNDLEAPTINGELITED